MLYTVFGLYPPGSSSCDLLIAGVVEGEHCCVDTTSHSEGYQRFADSVEASSPQEAEQLVLHRRGSE